MLLALTIVALLLVAAVSVYAYLWARYAQSTAQQALDMAAEAYAAADIAGHWAIGAAIQAGDDEAIRIIGDVWHGEC